MTETAGERLKFPKLLAANDYVSSIKQWDKHLHHFGLQSRQIEGKNDSNGHLFSCYVMVLIFIKKTSAVIIKNIYVNTRSTFYILFLVSPAEVHLSVFHSCFVLTWYCPSTTWLMYKNSVFPHFPSRILSYPCAGKTSVRRNPPAARSTESTIQSLRQ